MKTMPVTYAGMSSMWRISLSCAVALALLILAAYRGTAESILQIWSHVQTYNHGFVVLPIALWLIWRQRETLANVEPEPAPWVLIPFFGLAALWWIGHLVSVAAAMHFAMVAMIILVVPLTLGLRVARILMFPLCFMLFAVPIGDFMVPSLMYWTAEVLVTALRLTGLPVYQEGQMLVIPSGRWAVVEACGGIRYLLATFMVGSLFAYLNFRSTKRRIIFMAVSLVVPVVANWIRAYLIVMLGHLSNNKYGTGDDHLVYGWGFFGLVILALFFVGARWSEPEEVAPSTHHPVSGLSDGSVSIGRTPLFAAFALLVVTWPLWMHAAISQDSEKPAVQIKLPETMGAWTSVSVTASDWTPAFLNPTARQARVYRQEPIEVSVHISYYRGQSEDSKLVSSSNRLLSDRKVWHAVSRSRLVAGAAGQPLTWNTAQLMPMAASVSAPEHTPLTVWQLYWIDGRTFDSDAWAKLWQAWLALRGLSEEGAAIHLVSAQPDPVKAQAELTQFVNENFSMLQRTLERARSGQ